MLSEAQWKDFKDRYPVGAEVHVVIKKHASFGMFVSLPGGSDVSAVIDAINYRPGDADVYDPSQWPAEESEIVAVVSGYRDNHHQVSLRVGPSMWGQDASPAE